MKIYIDFIKKFAQTKTKSNKSHEKMCEKLIYIHPKFISTHTNLHGKI